MLIELFELKTNNFNNLKSKFKYVNKVKYFIISPKIYVYLSEIFLLLLKLCYK